MCSFIKLANGKIVQPSLVLVLFFSLFLALFAPVFSESTFALTETPQELTQQNISINMSYLCSTPQWKNGGLYWYISGNLSSSNLLNDSRVSSSFDSTTGFLHVVPNLSEFCSNGMIIDHFDVNPSGAISPSLDEFGNFYIYSSEVFYSGIYVTESSVKTVSTNTYRDFDLRLTTGANSHLTCRDNLNICKVNIGVHYDADNSADVLNNYSFTISSFKRSSDEFEADYNLSFSPYNDGIEIATGLKWGFNTGGYTPLFITSGSSDLDLYFKFSISDDFVVGSGEAGSDTSTDFDAERQWIENIIDDTDDINGSLDIDFSVLNPFGNWFALFSNDSCVHVPTIAGWFGSTDNYICTPWSSNIRAVITPIFNTLITLILFTFIVHWLQGDSVVSQYLSGSKY